MPNIADLMPLEVEPAFDKARKLAAWKAQQDTGFTDVGVAALEQGPIAFLTNRLSAGPSFYPPDPKFQWTDKLFDQISDGLDPKEWPALGDARSEQHAWYIRNMAMNRATYRDRLQAAGTSGTAANIIASLADPAYLAAGLASGGLSYAAGGSRLVQLARGGLLTAAAFGGLEEFKAATDPTITGTDVALAAVTGGLTSVAGGLTAGLGRGTRFAVGGLAAAAPGTVYAALSSEEQVRARDVMLGFLPQFLIGGTLASLHPTTRDMNVAVDKAARSGIRDQEFDVVKEQAAAMGVKPTEIISPEGGQAFQDGKIQDNIVEGLADQTVDGDHAAQPFLEALGRLKGMSPDKLLNRSEVDAVLEGTGYKTGNQGFPSVEDMQGYVQGMLNKRSGLTFGDRQRLIAQHEATNGVVTTHGEPTDVPRGTSSEAKGTGVPPAAIGAAAASDPVFTVWNEKPTNARNMGDLDLSSVQNDPSSGRRFSNAGIASKAESPDVGRLANMLMREDTPKKSGYSYYTGEEQARDWNATDSHNLLSVNEQQYQAYKASEKSAGRDPMAYHEFMEKAYRAYKTPGPSTVALSGNQFIDRVVENYREIRKGNLERAQRHGVRGALETQWDPNLIDRHTIQSKLDEAIIQHGFEKMLGWADDAIRAHPENADLSPKQTLALARDLLVGAGRQQTVTDAAEANFYANELEGPMAARLKAIDPSLTDAEIKEMIYSKSEVAPGEGTGEGNPPKFRRQIRMDTGIEHATDSGGTFRFDDVIDLNLERVALSNIRQLNGLSVMAEVYRNFSSDGSRGPEIQVESMPQLKTLLAERAVAQGLDKKAFEEDWKRIEVAHKVVMGIPREPNTLWSRSAKILRDVSFVRVINQLTGLRNVFEIGNAMAEPGMRAVVGQIPEFGNVLRMGRLGAIPDQLAKELMDVGVSLGDMNHRVMPGPEEGDVYRKDSARAKADAKLKAVEQGVRRAANLVNSVSLVGPGQNIMQRMIGRMISQKWFDTAQSGKLPSAARLGAMNMDEKMAQRIIAEMKGPNGATYEKLVFGKKLTAFNWSQWTDTEAAAALRQAISKTANRLILKPSPNQQSLWMTTSTGKLITQFRTYALAAYDSKTTFQTNMHDGTALLSFSAQMISKAIAYTLGTYLYAQIRPDKDKYLRDRLGAPNDPNWEKIAAAAFSQAEFSSLIPIGVDAMQSIRGKAPYFSFARTTGLGTHGFGGQADDPTAILTSIPAVDTINNTLRAVGVAPNKIIDFAHHAIDHSHAMPPWLTQEDAQHISSGWLPANMWGIKQGIQRMIQGLPKEPK